MMIYMCSKVDCPVEGEIQCTLSIGLDSRTEGRSSTGNNSLTTRSTHSFDYIIIFYAATTGYRMYAVFAKEEKAK